ncbi:S8 family serine peptidase [Pseudophaeobacter sp.]|uniref:S8 family serine peptidase n=1 Tax=Pseudophaeobacter sp. TaxID=1971739 RepID=UPI003299663B
MTKISIHPDLLLSILYGSPNGRRFTQDSPVLPEVWAKYAEEPGLAVPGLIVPRKSHQAHHVADELYERLLEYRTHHQLTERNRLDVADLPGLVTVRCQFDEVVNVILPLTRWWDTDGMSELVKESKTTIARWGSEAFSKLQDWIAHGSHTRGFHARSGGFIGHLGDFFPVRPRSDEAAKRTPFTDSAARLLLSIAALHAAQRRKNKPKDAKQSETDKELYYIVELKDLSPTGVGDALADLLKLSFLQQRSKARTPHYQEIAKQAEPDVVGRPSEGFLRLIHTLSLNRRGKGAVYNSTKTTKADAARRLFKVSNSNITWAVIDSGIDAQHFAFQDLAAKPVQAQGDSPLRLSEKESRVDKRYNVALITHLRNRDTLRDKTRRGALARAIANQIDMPGNDDLASKRDKVDKLLIEIRDEMGRGRQVNWDLVERIMRVRHDHAPQSHHGTHVAGTLGGAWTDHYKGEEVKVEGMCPDIRIIDFNVLGGSIEVTEFAVVAALRLIRHLNERNDYVVIHGANLSLAIPHDVSNYACGKTPVCVESETLVSSGVVVVAAAGNTGYNVFKTKAGEVPLHTESSIADPGNAESVITVGATHRLEPHTYGVSYFSSRGPTGDGRMKPDLVAPGEKINGPICNNEFARLEGTSMAAPHVSGAAALLMARFPELIGRPDRIKRILCDSATDLGRERSYQGAGLVDALRALQSI